jgi:YHS domain-containing protein
MKDVVRCKMCKAEVSEEACELAGYKTIVDGSEKFFCCKSCSEEYDEKKKTKK